MNIQAKNWYELRIITLSNFWLSHHFRIGNFDVQLSNPGTACRCLCRFLRAGSVTRTQCVATECHGLPGRSTTSLDGQLLLFDIFFRYKFKIYIEQKEKTKTNTFRCCLFFSYVCLGIGPRRVELRSTDVRGAFVLKEGSIFHHWEEKTMIRKKRFFNVVRLSYSWLKTVKDQMHPTVHLGGRLSRWHVAAGALLVRSPKERRVMARTSELKDLLNQNQHVQTCSNRTFGHQKIPGLPTGLVKLPTDPKLEISDPRCFRGRFEGSWPRWWGECGGMLRQQQYQCWSWWSWWTSSHAPVASPLFQPVPGLHGDG